ncbi:uncharacterized protein [Diabrotica undecimpunctata]|uniref:uncharacterized protein n=1 Tax=Diabrotica undecimpunctata TaxID=50387 RepID=UPI003B63FCAB
MPMDTIKQCRIYTSAGRETGHVKDLPSSGRTSISEAKKLVALDNNVHQSTVVRVSKKDKWHPYKVHLAQELLEDDFGRRIKFCETVMGKCDGDQGFRQKVVFSDEESFMLNGHYSEDDVKKALELIINGMSEREASRIFNIPRATISYRKSEKFHYKITHGPDPFLSKDEEEQLKLWIFHCQNRGFPVRVDDIKDSVKSFLESNPRVNPFVENRPGRTWLSAFLKRNPNISLRTSEGVTSANVLQDPTRIFNGDETCFYLCPKNKKVLAMKGSRNVYEIEHNPKVNLTVMFTFSAIGNILPPMIIYSQKKLPNDILSAVPNSWGIGLTENGWMDNKNFYEYIGNIFNRYLDRNNITRPVILFVDGHKTHLTVQTSQLCTDLKIILVALYPNATRLLQPADVAAFKPLKTFWNKAVLQFRKDNPQKVLTKVQFAPVLKSAIDRLNPDVIRSGFRACAFTEKSSVEISPNDEQENILDEEVNFLDTSEVFFDINDIPVIIDDTEIVNIPEIENETLMVPENEIFNMQRIQEYTNQAESSLTKTVKEGQKPKNS